jgi:NAD(P)-dependent dehydrogenase (short-subunit alcohol dehydrogenase family)
VNNAGYGLLGAVEEVSDADTRRQFDANVFGLLNVTRAVLPGMRSRRSGHVINMSSVGGFAARAGFAIYNASKFAVEGLSEAMAQELAPLGIRVMIIEPGFFRTEFLGRSLAMAPPIADYADTVGRVRGAIHSGKLVGDPARAAQAIIKAVENPNPPLRLVLGKDALARIRNKLTRVTRELESWEEVSSSTDFQ